MSRRGVLRELLAAAALAAAPLAAAAAVPCDPDDGGLTLPDGFCARLFADDAGPVRGLAVASTGEVFAALRKGGVLALRDADGDGRAETRERFGENGGHAVAFFRGHLYFAEDRRVVRWPWKPGQLEPDAAAEEIVRDLPRQREHAATGMAISPQGGLYVSVGAPSNSCQRENREPRSPGLDPCPQLARHAGLWRFDAAVAGQAQTDESRFATGMRHTLALAAHPQTGDLYAAVNGRDMLGQSWGYSDERNAALPAEELARVERGDDYGWPYCYYDGIAGKKVLAPEYGGDGSRVGRCRRKSEPDLAFPAHWAPMGIAFYTATEFPPRYRGGAFVAFRGSWNRAPLPQEGYRVAFVPFQDDRPTGEYETFAIGAKSPTSVRFTGVAVGPDGALYASADANEKIWRITAEPIEPVAP